MTIKIPRHRTYTAFVRLMRVGLPVGAVVLLILVFAWSTMEDFQDYFVEEVAHMKENLSNGELMNKMDKAILEATNKDGQPFRVEATKADQSGVDAVDLEAPTGAMTLKDGTSLNIKGNKGHYERAEEQLNLKGNVELESSSGFRFQTNDAQFDLKSGGVHGDQTINGKGPQGTVKAEGFELQDKGDRIIFKGRTKLVIDTTPRKGNRS